MSTRVVAGIFVGGRSRRMGGTPKGLLVADAATGETIVARFRRIFGALGVDGVLVGEHAAYGDLGMAHLDDDPHAEGPLAGVLALLEHAGAGTAIAVACDMPYVSEGLVRRLLTTSPTAPASVVAARRDERWEPFFARYDAEAALPLARARAAAGEMALQGLLAACGAQELVLDAEEHDELRDWDTPDDVRRGARV